MTYGLTRTVAPAEPVISVAELREHLRLHACPNEDTAAEDSRLEALIAAATQYFEDQTGRQLVTATYVLTLPCFPRVVGEILLPKAPVIDVTEVRYVDVVGDEQVLAATDYDLYADDLPARLAPAFGLYWPVAWITRHAVRVTYRAGYGAAADVDPLAKQAVLLLAAAWNEFAEEMIAGTIITTIPIGAARIIANYQIGDPLHDYGS